MIEKEWKLFLTYTPGYFGYQLYPPLSLFHLKNDPHEERDVKDQNPEKVKELLTVLDEWRNNMGITEANDPMIALGNKGPRTYDFPEIFIKNEVNKFS